MTRNIEDFELLNVGSQLRRAGEHAFDYYRGEISREDCQTVVEESYQLLDQSAVIKHHLVALADRWSIERLRRLGILSNRLRRTALEVLFVDADDTGAGAAAATLLATYGRGRVHTSSAGARPAAATDSAVGRVATEMGLDLAAAFPKAVTREAIQVADVVVILGRLDASVESAWSDAPGGQPTLEQGQAQRWEDVPSLSGQPDDVIRAALDDLDRRVLALLLELLAAPANSKASTPTTAQEARVQEEGM